MGFQFTTNVFRLAVQQVHVHNCFRLVYREWFFNIFFCNIHSALARALAWLLVEKETKHNTGMGSVQEEFMVFLNKMHATIVECATMQSLP